jgi:hypothetical protein
MAASQFKIEQNTIIYKYVDKLIRSVSKLDPSQQNYKIAEEFIVSNIETNNYPDVNENEV